MSEKQIRELSAAVSSHVGNCHELLSSINQRADHSAATTSALASVLVDLNKIQTKLSKMEGLLPDGGVMA